MSSPPPRRVYSPLDSSTFIHFLFLSLSLSTSRKTEFSAQYQLFSLRFSQSSLAFYFFLSHTRILCYISSSLEYSSYTRTFALLIYTFHTRLQTHVQGVSCETILPFDRRFRDSKYSDCSNIGIRTVFESSRAIKINRARDVSRLALD